MGGEGSGPVCDAPRCQDEDSLLVLFSKAII